MPFLLPAAAATGTAATGTAAAAGTAAASSIPFLQIASGALTGIQLLSGIQSKLFASSQAKQEAKLIEGQARHAEQQQIAQDSSTVAKGRVIAGASGVNIASGSPLTQMLDNITQLELNAANVRFAGRLQAFQRKQEAAAFKSQIPGVVFDVLGGKSAQSFLSQLLKP